MVKHEVLQACNAEQRDHHHKRVGGYGKHAASLLHTSQIGPTHQHQQHQGNRHFVGQKTRIER